MADTVVYRASKIITMDPTRPEATHVAVRDGLIVAVGDADCATPWGDFRRDDRYRDTVLMPGFVEGHAHMMTGAMWNYAYAGHQDRIDPAGRKWEGLADIAAVMAGLKRALASLPA
ncbi:MAG: amidohydrolase, partial [Nitrobacter sp.]